MTDSVQFIEDTHQYFINRVEFPSVSTVLGFLADYSRVPRDVLAFKRSVGRAVHRVIELGDELDPDSIDEQIAGYVASWEKFKKTRPLRLIATERIVYSKKHRYAGRLDIVWEFLDQPGLLWTVDAKCTYDMSPATSLQTAAYQHAWNEMGEPRSLRRAGLQLKPDGSQAEFYPYDSKTDFNIYLNCLNVYRWQKNQRRAA